MKIFLVEDEWIHAEDIRISIESMGFEWLGYASEGFAAISKIKETDADVVLIDMSLHGALSGIDIAAHIAKTLHKPFIFVTSHTEEEIINKGIDTNPVAYLTKPVNDGDLKAALLKAKKWIADNGGAREAVTDASGTALMIRVGKNLKPLEVSDILFIQTDLKNYCRIHSMGNNTFSVKKSLSVLSDMLPQKKFFRIHKEYIINIGHISRVDETEHLVYINNQAIPIGNHYRQHFFDIFNIL
jgi:DNA-binding LytR/AlgR family response regulator